MKNDGIKVSVLIPIYGVEKYIERCATSLFNQTMTDGIEFIFVNDATKDQSVKILERVLEEYPQRKHQVKIINHPQNKGLAVVRVTALKVASGKYVAHCDSDDWVEPEMYERMYDTAQKSDADIVVCDYCRETETSSWRITQSLLETREKIVSSMLKFEELHPFLWIRLIKREFYLKYEFFANPNITFCEDLAVTIPMHLSTDKVQLVGEGYYHYNVSNTGSMTQEKSMEKVESCRLAMDELEDYIRANGYYSVLKALNYIRFLYFIPLITTLETYNPERWLELDNQSTEIDLMLRSRISVWLVRHKLFKVNKLLQIIVKKIFNK